MLLALILKLTEQYRIQQISTNYSMSFHIHVHESPCRPMLPAHSCIPNIKYYYSLPWTLELLFGQGSGIFVKPDFAISTRTQITNEFLYGNDNKNIQCLSDYMSKTRTEQNDIEIFKYIGL